MKELLDQVMAYLPQYFTETGQLLAGPKTFMETRGRNSDFYEGNSAYIFFGLTIVLMALISAFYPSHRDVYVELVSSFILVGVELIAISFVVYAAWFIVGGRVSYYKILVTYIYVVGPMLLIALVIGLVGWGYF